MTRKEVTREEKRRDNESDIVPGVIEYSGEHS